MKQDEFIFIWAGQQPMFKQYLQMLRYDIHRNIVGNCPIRSVIWVKNGWIEKYFDKESIEKIREDGKRLLQKEEGLKLVQGTKKIIEDYRTISKQLRENINSENIIQLFDRFEKVLLKLFAYFITSTEHVSFHVEERLKFILHQINSENHIDLFLQLTTPTEKDLIHKEKESWLKVLKNSTDEALHAHMLEFPFLFCNIGSEKDAIDIMRSRIKDKSLEELENELRIFESNKIDLKHKQKKLYGKLGEECTYLSELMKDLAVLRLDIKSCWSGLHFLLFPLYKKLAKISNQDVEDIMMFYSTADMKKLLENNLPLTNEELEQRKNAYLLHYEQGELKLYVGEEAFRKKEDLLSPVEKSSIIKGTTANKGKVTGRVKLVKSDDLREIARIAKEVEKDHILVTGMTNPNMMILVEKVKGIITDEGGMLCHASIISREMNIPCIVGCQKATQILEDGELIELDAEKGIVKKIKKF